MKSIIDRGNADNEVGRVDSTFMNTTFARSATSNGKYYDFLSIGESSSGDPRQSRKPRSSTRRNVERIGIVHRTRSRSDERVQPPLVQAVSARAVEPKRPTGTTSDTFSFFNNGRSAARGY